VRRGSRLRQFDPQFPDELYRSAHLIRRQVPRRVPFAEVDEVRYPALAELHGSQLWGLDVHGAHGVAHNYCLVDPAAVGLMTSSIISFVK